MRTYKGPITALLPHQKVVVPTNKQGRHGRGFALWARVNVFLRHGYSEGPFDKGYCIYTKDLTKKKHPSVSIIDIQDQLRLFYIWAESDPESEYLVPYTAGTHLLSGYTPEQMAFIFATVMIDKHGDGEPMVLYPIPDNVIFEEGFAELVKNEHAKK